MVVTQKLGRIRQEPFNDSMTFNMHQILDQLNVFIKQTLDITVRAV